MGKIESLKIVDNEIIETVERLEQNKLNPSKKDLLFLMKKYNESNTSGYTEREVTVCADCRRYIFKFWQNTIIEWRKRKQSK